MESISMLKRQVLKQQKQIDALTTTQTFIFGFLASLAEVDFAVAAQVLGEMLEDPDASRNEYFYSRLESLKGVIERAVKLPEKPAKEVPSWFRGIIKGGLLEKEDEEER